MSENIIVKAIEATSTFAMAHPVLFTIIVVAAVGAYAAIKISKNSSNDKKDEDRNVGNRNGKIRQS